MHNQNYTDINSNTIDSWVKGGWEWGIPINHEIFEAAQKGNWSVLLTPTKNVPKEWFCDFNGAKILGLASGGGQQMPIFTALGADCTVMDYSKTQLENETMVANREGYTIKTIHADMTKSFPFEDESFDLIFHPVSNCYVENVYPIWRECFRVLKKGGCLLAGLDNGLGYVFEEKTMTFQNKLPFNPLKDSGLYEESLKTNMGIQFSHTIEEQIGGQLKAGLTLTDIYQDTDGSGTLHEYNVPTFFATRCVK